MEQKKTLWIIAAVGIFLLVVLGGAAIVYRSSVKDTPIIASAKTTDKQAQAGWSNQPAQANNNEIQRPGFDSMQANKVNEMYVVSENTTVYDLNKSAPAEAVQNQGITTSPNSTTIDLNALKKELTAEVAAATANQNQQPQNINITVTMPSDTQQQAVIVSPDYSDKSNKNTVKVEKNEKKEAPASVRPNKPETQKQEAPKTTAAKTTTKKESTPKATEAKVSESKAAVQTPKAVTRYWVQVAAYTNKKTAENAREVLTSNKITSDIFTYQDAKNRLFYRVRVGPYTTKSEAEYWQAKIAKIDDFKDSKSYVASKTD